MARKHIKIRICISRTHTRGLCTLDIQHVYCRRATSSSSPSIQHPTSYILHPHQRQGGTH